MRPVRTRQTREKTMNASALGAAQRLEFPQNEMSSYSLCLPHDRMLILKMQILENTQDVDHPIQLDMIKTFDILFYFAGPQQASSYLNNKMNFQKKMQICRFLTPFFLHSAPEYHLDIFCKHSLLKHNQHVPPTASVSLCF